jgi:O-antigen ligase
MLAAVAVEIIHAFHPGIGQYGPWIGVWMGTFLAALKQWQQQWDWIHLRFRYLSWGFAYLLILVIATIVGIDRAVSVRYAIGVPAVLWVVGIYIPQLVREGQLSAVKVIQSWAILGAIFSASAGIAAVAFHSGFPVPVGHRVILAWQWPFANKNTLGLLMALAVPAAFGLIFYPDKPWGGRGLAIAVTILVVMGDALSYARSGWIASLIGMAVFTLAYFGRRGLIGMAIGFPAAAILLVLKTGLKRWTLLWDKGLNGRIVLWKAGFSALHHRWWFGVGPGNSPQALLPYVPRIYAGLTPQDSIMRTAVELGLIGLGIWLVIVVGAVIKTGLVFWRTKSRRLPRWTTSMIGALLLATLAQQMVESAFLGGISFGDFFFTFLIGWVWFVLDIPLAGLN